MAKHEVVFGVYLDRRGGAIMRAEVSSGKDSSTPQTLTATHCIKADWPSRLEVELRDGLLHLLEFAKMASSERVRMAVSSPGPFVSLNHRKRTPNYGLVHSHVGHLPTRGINLPNLLRETFERAGGVPSNLEIEVHTDAQACAIGEAVKRDLPDDSTLAFVLVTDGIGLGLVRGRTPIGSALHSEFGMMSVRWLRADRLKPGKNDRQYGVSLSQFAENGALATRAGLLPESICSEDLNESHQEALQHRAYYLAQGCLACAVMIAPHRIVLGADIDYKGTITEYTMADFREFIIARKIHGEPVFDFPEINEPDYISSPENILKIGGIPPLHATGALGLCHAAASMDN